MNNFTNREYKHEPFTDFSQEANYNAYVEALNKVESYLDQHYPLIIGGERITTEDKVKLSLITLQRKQK